MKTVIIGDVHGYYELFRRLLDKICLCTSDTVVIAGDLVLKGPESGKVVRLVRTLIGRGVQTVLVQGNHDDKILRFRRHERRRELDGMPNPIEDSDGSLAVALKQLDEDDICFLNNSVLFHRLPEFNSIVVHAGIEPALSALPNPTQFAKLSTLNGTRHRPGSRIPTLV